MNLDNEFIDNTYNELLINKACAQYTPIMGNFELTPLCNMRCNMCYIQHNLHNTNIISNLQNIDFWINVIDEAIKQGMLFCLLTGGEIFTYPNFRKLYETIIKKPIYIVLNTNATLLNEETVQWLAKNPPRRLNISLYGANNETYSKLCHYSQGYDRVINAFQLLKKYKINFRVHCALTPSNINDYEEIIKICNKFNVPIQFSNYMFPATRKDNELNHKNERFTPKEMANISLKMNHDKYNNWNEIVANTISVVNNYKNSSLYNIDNVLCKGGKCSFWINWKGELNNCGISNNNTYDLNKVSFKEAWKKNVEFIDNTHLSQKCATCKYKVICPTCLASAVCETGSVDGTPEYLCEYCEEYYKLILEEYERLSKDE